MKDEHIIEWAQLFYERYGWLDSSTPAEIIARYMHGGIQAHVTELIEQSKLLTKDLEALLHRLQQDNDDGNTI